MQILIQKLCAAADLIRIYPKSDKTPQQAYIDKDHYIGILVASFIGAGSTVELIGAEIHGLTKNIKEQIVSAYMNSGAKILTWWHHGKTVEIDLLTGEEKVRID